LTDHNAAMGLALPCPAISGAEPWIGSNMEGYFFSGLMFAPAARPIPPAMAAPRSVIMSPKRFDVTFIWNLAGSFTKNMDAASTRHVYVLTSGYSLAILS